MNSTYDQFSLPTLAKDFIGFIEKFTKMPVLVCHPKNVYHVYRQFNVMLVKSKSRIIDRSFEFILSIVCHL